MNDTTKRGIYEIVDSFLVEAKDQHGNDRSLERLNADRHLAVENIMALLSRLDQERVEKVRGMFKEFNPENIEFSDPVKVDGWNECLSAVLTKVFNVEG